jgi:hypothetical protein
MENQFHTLGCHLSMLDRASPFHISRVTFKQHQTHSTRLLTFTHRVERRLINTSIFLNHGGKLQLVNSVLSSLLTLYMCSIKVPIDILNQVDKYRRHCLWAGGDINAKKPHWLLGYRLLGQNPKVG